MKLLSYFTAVLLLVFALLCTLPFTAPGTRLLLQLADRSSAVQVKYGGGSLFGDLQLAKLSIEAGQVSVQLEQLQSRLDLSCFWNSTFCFQALKADSLSVDIADAGEGGTDDEEGTVGGQDSEPALLSIPYAYVVPELELQRLNVTWPGGSWQQQDLRAQLELSGGRLAIGRLEAQSSLLTLETDAQAETPYAGFEPPQLFMPLELLVDKLALRQPRVEAGEASYRLQGLELAGSWHGYDLQLGELILTAEDTGRLSARGSLELQQHWPLAVVADVALPQGIDPAGLGGRELTLELGGDLDQLQLALHAAGIPELHVEVQAGVTAVTLPYSGEAVLRWPAPTRLDDVAPISEPFAALQLAAPVQASIDGTLDSQRITLATELSGLGYQALALSLDARLQSGSVFIDALELLDPGSDSSLQATGELDLGSAWSLVAQANSDGIYLPPLLASEPGRMAGEFALQASGDEAGWQLQLADVDLAGSVDGLPASVQGYAGITSAMRLLPGELQAAVNGTQLSIDAPPGSGDVANVNLQLDDLGRWFADARGSITLQGSGALDQQQMSIQGEGSDISLAGLEIPTAKLRMDYGGPEQNIDVMLQAPTVRQENYELSAVTLSLQGNAARHRLLLSTQGTLDGQLRVDGGLEQSEWQGVLQPAEIDTGAGPWMLEQPVSLLWNGEQGSLQVAEHCWRHPDFDLCAQPLQVGRVGDVDLRLSGDVSAFNGILPPGLRVAGNLQSQLASNWNTASPLSLEAAVQVRALQVQRLYGMGERVTVNWESIDLDVSRRGDSLAIKGDVVREGRRVLAVDALLPGSADQQISGQLTLDALQLGTFSPWVTELSTLQGSLSGVLQLQGTAANPQATGALGLRDGKLVVVGNPTELTDLNLDLQLDGSSGALQGQGMLGGGPVRLRGNITAQPELSLELAISGERHQVLLPPASEMLVSEELSLLLTRDLLDVGGDIRVHEGVLRHEELPEGSVGISRDVVQVDVRGNVIGKDRPFDVRADILLHLREKFRIEGEGISATLGGDLQLRQEPGKALQVFGNLNLQGGELYVYRQHLQVRRGTIAFSGPADNPELNIAAEREIRSDGVTVGARLTGPLDEPTLDVYSDPVMSQGEAMSYLVRGRALDSGAGADGTALALSLGADVVNRSGIVSDLNRLPLISNVAFGASGEQDDTAATVSGYIGSRIYLSYGIGLYEPINVLTARLYLQSRLWLEVMSRLENSVDLYYSFDIR